MAGIKYRAGTTLPREDGPGLPNPPRYSGEISGVVSPDGVPAVALALRAWAPGTTDDAYALALLGPDYAESLVLGPFEEEDVVARWRALALETGLEMMIETPEGELRAPYPQIGRVLVGPIRVRRRHGLLNDRRPRFLVRRKTGRLTACPTVHREAEIAGGESA